MNHVPFSFLYHLRSQNNKIDYPSLRHRYFTLQTRIPI